MLKQTYFAAHKISIHVFGVVINSMLDYIKQFYRKLLHLLIFGCAYIENLNTPVDDLTLYQEDAMAY